MGRLHSRLLALTLQVAVGAFAFGASAAPLVEPGGPTTVAARSAGADAFDGAQALGDADLNKERGGFITAGGIKFDIGATVQTTINGSLALVNTLNLTPEGKVQQTTWVNPSLPNATVITPQNVAALSSSTGINFNGVPNANGVVVKGDQGYTAVLANMTQSALQNLVINTANGQTITQNTNITLTLPGFEANELQAARANVFNQLNAALNMARLSARH